MIIEDTEKLELETARARAADHAQALSRLTGVPARFPRTLSVETLPLYREDASEDGSLSSGAPSFRPSASTTSLGAQTSAAAAPSRVPGNTAPATYTNARSAAAAAAASSPSPAASVFGTSSTSSTPSSSSLAPTRPTNFLSISRTNGSIRGTFIIDPDLAIPEAGLPPLARGESRKNLSLSCVNGAIKVDIRISPSMPRPASATPPRASLSLTSRNGSISVRMHSAGTPFKLALSVQNGSAHVRLPRAFRGPLTSTLRTGALGASASLAKTLTVLSVPSTSNAAGAGGARARVAFVGAFPGSGWGARGAHRWTGDEVVLEATNASVRVSFVDDGEDEGVVAAHLWPSVLGELLPV